MSDVKLDLSSFSAHYGEARDKFLSAAKALNAPLAAYTNPNKGPKGETLTTDLAWIGPEDAAKVAVLISATHGVEGFCGSGAQVAWMRSDSARRLPPDVAVLVIHAINPYGFAWIRRVTEEGVDLNRNHVDFTKPLPENPGYAELADAFVPAEIEGPVLEAALAKLKAWRERHGDAAYYRAYSAGQYTHPDGVFYGGAGPTWSRRTTEAICQRFLARRRYVAGVDFHTGLGPHGYGDPICHHPVGSPALARALAWYGDSLTGSTLGTTSSFARDGLSGVGYVRSLPGVEVNFVTLEYGTYPREQGHKAFREDHWLHRPANAGSFDTDKGRAIKAQIRKQFYPDLDAWKEMVLWRAFQVVRQTVDGLGAER